MKLCLRNEHVKGYSHIKNGVQNDLNAVQTNANMQKVDMNKLQSTVRGALEL